MADWPIIRSSSENLGTKFLLWPCLDLIHFIYRWGHFSTVWLVKDTMWATQLRLFFSSWLNYLIDISSNRHCALKVVKSARRYTETALDEVKILKSIQQAEDKYTGRSRIVELLDSFEHLSRGDLHVCMVFEPLGETLLTLIEKNKKTGISGDLVKSIVKQILTGLAFLHESCDLVHTCVRSTLIPTESDKSTT